LPLEEILNENDNSITQVVGSWKSGITVLLTLPSRTLTGFLDKLAKMPNINAVEEKPLIKEGAPNSPNKFGVLQKPATSPAKRIHITL
jgi:hypothetical protein